MIEIVSEDYRKNDVETKVEHYERAGVPFYIIVDREQIEGPAKLLGYHLGLAGYEPMPLDDQGRLRLEELGISLGAVDNRVVCYDLDTGKEIGDYVQVCQELAAAEARALDAEARAAAEAQARAVAEARIRELEELLRRRNGEQHG